VAETALHPALLHTNGAVATVWLLYGSAFAELAAECTCF